jgi:hypothetical protein
MHFTSAFYHIHAFYHDTTTSAFNFGLFTYLFYSNFNFTYLLFIYFIYLRILTSILILLILFYFIYFT